MGKFIKLAWRNMWRNWRRTAIATVAIVLGLLLLIFMNGIIKGADQAIFGNAVRLYGGNIQIHAPGYRDKANRLPLYPLAQPDAVVRAALEQPAVMAASQRISTGGLVKNGKETYPVIITAVDPEVEAPISILAENIRRGRFLAPGDSGAIVIGQGLATLLEVSPGDRITLIGRRKSGEMRQRGMTIVGVYSLGLGEAEKGAVLIPLDDAQPLYNLRDEVTEVNISLHQVGQEGPVVASLQADLPNAEVDSWDTLRPELRQTMDVKSSVTSMFGVVVLLIASIGILNLMMMAAFERTREMGVLAALGMKGREIMFLFLLEGMFIGLVGSVMGCISGYALVWAVGRVGLDFSSMQGMGEITALMGSHIYPSTTVGYVVTQGIIVTLIATLASLYPAWQASRREPAEAMHQI